MSFYPATRYGRATHKALNARRHVYTDPDYDKIIVLASLNGNGTAFVDYGPYAVTGTLPGSSVDKVVTQDATFPLFNQTTLRITKLTAVSQSRIARFTLPFWIGNIDFNVQGWFYQDSFSGAASTGPSYFAFVNGTSSSTLQLINLAPDGLTCRLITSNVGSVSVAFSAQTWNYFSVQYIAAAATFYLSVNGAAPVTVLDPGWWAPGTTSQLNIGQNNVNNVYNAAVAQIRIATGNAFGTNAVPVPSLPFPQWGP